jgi:hypothetical protein
MCTIENTEKLCKGTLEACSVVMVPSVMSCGRGAWVSTMRGAHKKSSRAAGPWRWGQGQRPAPGTAIVAGPGFILGSHNHARRPCPSQSSSSTVRQTPSFDGGNVGATAGIGGNPACDYPGAVEIATRWAEYNGCVGELKLGDKPKYDLNTAVDGKETTVNKFQQCPNGIDVELWTLEGVPHPPRFYEVFGANGIKGSSPLNHGEVHLSCKRGASHTPPGRFPHASRRRSMDPTTTCCPNVACPARGHIGPGTMGIQAWKERRCLCTPCRKTCSATTGTAFSRLRTTAETVVLCAGRPQSTTGVP